MSLAEGRSTALVRYRTSAPSQLSACCLGRPTGCQEKVSLDPWADEREGLTPIRATSAGVCRHAGRRCGRDDARAKRCSFRLTAALSAGRRDCRLPCAPGVSRPSQSRAGRQHRWPAGVDGADDLGVVDALQVDRRDAEVGVSELSLDDVERDAFARHLDGVRVPQLVRREAAAHAGVGVQVPEGVTGGGA
jgi:hypothetical protein